MVGCVGNRMNPFVMRWFAVRNDTVGGWAVATADELVSVIDRRGGGELIADLIRDEATAVYIVEMHNTAIGYPSE
jgi:hypothetical protein